MEKTRHENPIFKAYNENCKKRDAMYAMARKLYVYKYVDALESCFNSSLNWELDYMLDEETNTLFIFVKNEKAEIFLMFEESEDSKPVFIKVSINTENFKFSETKKLNLDWNTTDEFTECIYCLIGKCFIESR